MQRSLYMKLPIKLEIQKSMGILIVIVTKKINELRDKIIKDVKCSLKKEAQFFFEIYHCTYIIYVRVCHSSNSIPCITQQNT